MTERSTSREGCVSVKIGLDKAEACMACVKEANVPGSSRSVSVAESVKEKVRGGYVQTSKGIGSEAR
jgi:hypothetical protein